MSTCSSNACGCSATDAASAAPTLAPVAAGAPANGLERTRYRIENMDCPTEEALIRTRLATVDAVRALDFNLVQRTLAVDHEPEAGAAIEQALAAIGMHAQRMLAAGVDANADATPAPQHKPWWPLALGGVAALLAESMHWALGESHWLVMVLALLAIACGGLSTYRKGWIALRNRTLNMNALMSIAVTGAMLIGHWPEAAMVMVLFAIAEAIEARSLDSARNAVRALMELAPDTACVQQADGRWEDVPAHAVTVGSRVRVRPGARIALDGVIESGNSTVNQAPITGESLPVDKAVGDAVFAGTINEAGSFDFRVTAAATHSTLARIIHAVEAAQSQRAPTQRFVDRFASIYTPIVFAVALAVAILSPLLFGLAWVDAVYRSLVLLVIACPCALVISTPVSVVSALTAAARQGILIKGGVYLEEGRKLRWLALDKTGTITHGRPVQTDFISTDAGKASEAQALAASLAARSDHPVSKALADAAGSAGLALQEVEDFAALPGHGSRGRIAGTLYHLGNARLLGELGMNGASISAQVEALEAEGKSVVMLAGDDGVLATFAVADTVKDSSRAAIAELHALGIHTVMLSGDNPHTAAAIAAQVGIERSVGNLLPEDKLGEIEALASQGRVGMVGDGINDAPALARADIGFAMGAMGTDTAIETADVALMDDDLRKLPRFVRLSQATARVLKQNIALALGIKAVFLLLAFGGQATMWMAVFADMGTSLLVVANGLRLLRR